MHRASPIAASRVDAARTLVEGNPPRERQRTIAAATAERPAGNARLLGPAMRFVLLLARARARQSRAALPGGRAPEPSPLLPLPMLWDLAERYHPEQTWLAESWLRGDRTLAEIARSAPREPLARGFFEAATALVDRRRAGADAGEPAPRTRATDGAARVPIIVADFVAAAAAAC